MKWSMAANRNVFFSIIKWIFDDMLNMYKSSRVAYSNRFCVDRIFLKPQLSPLPFHIPMHVLHKNVSVELCAAPISLFRVDSPKHTSAYCTCFIKCVPDCMIEYTISPDFRQKPFPHPHPNHK